MPGSANFEILREPPPPPPKKKKCTPLKRQQQTFQLCFWQNEECPKLLCGLGIGHRRRQTILMRNSSIFFQFGNLQYRALCDDLVVLEQWAGVIYLSFSIDTAPQWILWKRSREDWSLRASKGVHSSSSSHLHRVQQAAVIWTFSIWLIWSFE